MTFGRNDAKAETPVLRPPHAKSWLIGKDSDAGRDWGQEEKGTTEDEMAGWHHWLNGRESEWSPGVGDGQGGLACCNSWGRKESDTTERLIWSDLSKVTEWGIFCETQNWMSPYYCSLNLTKITGDADWANERWRKESKVDKWLDIVMPDLGPWLITLVGIRDGI